MEPTYPYRFVPFLFPKITTPSSQATNKKTIDFDIINRVIAPLPFLKMSTYTFESHSLEKFPWLRKAYATLGLLNKFSAETFIDELTNSINDNEDNYTLEDLLKAQDFLNAKNQAILIPLIMKKTIQLMATSRIVGKNYRLLGQLFETLVKKTNQPACLAIIAWTMGTLKYNSSYEFYEICKRIKPIEEKLELKHLSLIIWAAAQLCIKGTIIDDLEKITESALLRYSENKEPGDPESICRLALGIAILSITSFNKLQWHDKSYIFSLLLIHEKLKNLLTALDKLQLRQIYLWHLVYYLKVKREYTLPQYILDQNTLFFQNGDNVELNSSIFQQQILEALDNLYIIGDLIFNIKTHSHIAYEYAYISFSYRYKEFNYQNWDFANSLNRIKTIRFVIVLYEQSQKLVFDPYALSGEFHLHKCLLDSYFDKVIYLSFEEWSDLNTPEERIDYLKRKTIDTLIK